jgi:lysine 2,3-aminomutase
MSRIDWTDPANDPLLRQFVPMESIMMPDHPETKLDSLNEKKDSKVDSVVHRYPDKALFLSKRHRVVPDSCSSLTNQASATSTCPVLCAYCTRSYGVGANTELVEKVRQTTRGMIFFEQPELC